MQHRNSQKRIYIPKAVYFITTNIRDGYPFFEVNLLCELFVKDLELCQRLKEFVVFGYKINPDHIHLLIQPIGIANYSQIMRSLKTNFARNANYILGYNDLMISGSKVDSREFAFHIKYLKALRNSFVAIHGKGEIIPKFQWQLSFHDHIIRDKSDYYAHLKYIENQWMKHDLKENKHCFISKQFPDLSYTKTLKFPE